MQNKVPQATIEANHGMDWGSRAMPMNAGEKTIDWLFREQLRVDPEWSIKLPTGFIWWADRHAQTIEMLGSETNEDGETAYLISTRTEMLRNLELTAGASAGINALLMCFASMAGPVFDEKTGTLSLCSLVRVHEPIREWMSGLISLASVLQIAEARILAPDLAKLFGAESAESGHPLNGQRPLPDELAEIVKNLIAPAGRQPCKWLSEEFEQVVNDYMRRPPCLLATNGSLGFTAEFPFGRESSLFRGTGREPHPRYGNGLLLLQLFRADDLSKEEGVRLALALNSSELTENPAGYGFGSYCYREGCVRFTSFLPNAAYRQGLLPNFYYAGASRACHLSILLNSANWADI
jgi:hypothetical protein